MVNALLIHPDDDVVTLMRAVNKGGALNFIISGREQSLIASEDIPIYHKAALKDITKGAALHKYGEIIGHATRDIKKGEHVHTQNLSDIAEKEGVI